MIQQTKAVMQERGKPNKKGFVDVWSTTWLNSFKCECWWDWRSINKVNYHMHCTKMVSSFSVFLHIHTTVKSISFSTHIIQIFSPWYNHNGWLGVKHQVTYCTNLLPHLSLFWNQQQIFSHIFFSTETSNKSSATSFSLLKPATNLQPHLSLCWNQHNYCQAQVTMGPQFLIMSLICLWATSVPQAVVVWFLQYLEHTLTLLKVIVKLSMTDYLPEMLDSQSFQFVLHFHLPPSSLSHRPHEHYQVNSVIHSFWVRAVGDWEGGGGMYDVRHPPIHL